MIECVSSDFLKKELFIKQSKVFLFLPSLRLAWPTRKYPLWIQNANMSLFLLAPHVSFKIYLTIKLSNLEFLLPIVNSFIAQSCELIRSKEKRASHSERIQFNFSFWQENMFKYIISKQNMQLKYFGKTIKLATIINQ